MTVGKIDNVIALRTSHFLFVHAGELFFNIAERKKENKREEEEEFEWQNKKRRTERKDQQWRQEKQNDRTLMREFCAAFGTAYILLSLQLWFDVELNLESI